MKHVERWFWAICLAATLLGLFLPELARPIRRLVTVFLAGILFFTGLKLDLRAALGELARPGLVLYAAAMLLVALPLGMWGLARLAVPEFAIGVLIVAAMPAGLAGSSLTDIVKGNPALALVVTVATSVLCPLVVPAVIGLGAGPAAAGGGWAFLGRQALYLAAILFVPLAAAHLVRRLAPRLVARHHGAFTGLSIISLALLILSAMSANSADFLRLLRSAPGRAAVLMGFMFAFSGLLHLAGYFLAPWRPPADRAALSVNAAYVNNGLAIVFATRFFKPLFGSEAVLPAILLEVPMVLALLPLKWYLARRVAPPEAGKDG